MKKTLLISLILASAFMFSCGGQQRANAIETVNKLFVATDNANWAALEKIFTEEVDFDMTSLAGGEPAKLKATDITAAWKKGLKGLKVHHLVGNHIAQVTANKADVFCYGVATHYLKNATDKNTRTFAGSYNFKLLKIGTEWRVSGFKYNHKYLDGNAELHKFVK